MSNLLFTEVSVEQQEIVTGGAGLFFKGLVFSSKSTLSGQLVTSSKIVTSSEELSSSETLETNEETSLSIEEYNQND